MIFVPLQVLCVKNLSPQASVAQLVALFSRFEQEDGLPVVYRLLTGRMKGQAFITLPGERRWRWSSGSEPPTALINCGLPDLKCSGFLLADAETAQKALQLVHGYRLLGKPLVVEFGRERQEDEKQKKKKEEEEK